MLSAEKLRAGALLTSIVWSYLEIIWTNGGATVSITALHTGYITNSQHWTQRKSSP